MITQIILAPIASAIWNRIRGGGVIKLPGESDSKKHTQIRRVLFAVALGAIALNPMVAAILFVSCLTGWGFPVSAAIGAKKPNAWEGEFFLFDSIAHCITSLMGYTSRRYGVAWLTLHGLFFGALAAVAMGSPFPVIWAGMGLCYSFAGNWERGELYDGALKGLGISLALLHTLNQ